MSVRQLMRRTGGIGCREGGGTFLWYCPHQDNYEELLKRFLADLFIEKDTAEKVSLRFGIFANAEREPNIEERFMCAKIAADTVEDGSQQLFGLYDRS